MSNLLNNFLNSFQYYLAAMSRVQTTVAGKDPVSGVQTTECTSGADGREMMVGEA